MRRERWWHILWKRWGKPAAYINEPALYTFAFSSKAEAAKIFKRWVCGTALPSIRKTGQYQLPSIMGKQFALLHETDLHYRVVAYIRRYHPNAIIIPGLGEVQDSSAKCFDPYCKGYKGGQLDLIISNLHINYSGFVVELKVLKCNGVTRNSHKLQIADYAANAYKTVVYNDYDLILKEIKGYMSGTRVRCSRCSRMIKTYQITVRRPTR